jgi:hypothetical protein
MSQTKAPVGPFPPGGSDHVQGQVADADHLDGGASSGQGGIRHFVRHVAEMVIAMMIGMAVGVGIFSAIVGESYKSSRHDYPTAALLVMAIGMTIPMVAWMRFRRHTWRDSLEMGAAMLFPAVPFLVVVWAQVVRDAPTGPYMAVSTVAMLALMFYRWEVYSAHSPRPVRRSAR